MNYVFVCLSKIVRIPTLTKKKIWIECVFFMACIKPRVINMVHLRPRIRVSEWHVTSPIKYTSDSVLVPQRFDYFFLNEKRKKEGEEDIQIDLVRKKQSKQRFHSNWILELPIQIGTLILDFFLLFLSFSWFIDFTSMSIF